MRMSPVELIAGTEPSQPVLPDNYGSRHGRIQPLLNLYHRPRHLEIGLNEGVTFKAVSAATKVDVDPKFLFDRKLPAKSDPTATYIERTIRIGTRTFSFFS
jgi:hypothetical protein